MGGLKLENGPCGVALLTILTRIADGLTVLVTTTLVLLLRSTLPCCGLLIISNRAGKLPERMYASVFTLLLGIS